MITSAAATRRHTPAPAKPGPIVYSDQQLVQVLVHLAQGEITLSRRTFEHRRRLSDPSSHIYECRFGSWNDALRIAGLQTTEQPLQFQGATTKWTEAQLVVAVRHCLRQTGSTALAVYESWRTGSFDGVTRADAPPASTIRFRLGSWSRATVLACRSAREDNSSSAGTR